MDPVFIALIVALGVVFAVTLVSSQRPKPPADPAAAKKSRGDDAGIPAQTSGKDDHSDADGGDGGGDGGGD